MIILRRLIWVSIAAALLLSTTAVVAYEGLPEQVYANWYDPDVIATYDLLEDKPFMWMGQTSPRLESVILKGSPLVAQLNMPLMTPVVYVVALIKDTQDHRIIAISEAFYHFFLDESGQTRSNGLRSVKLWIDEAWIAHGKGDGTHWISPTDGKTTPPMKEAQLKPLMTAFANQILSGLGKQP